MAKIASKFLIEKNGRDLIIVIPGTFADEYSIKTNDYVLPCIEDNKKMNDPVIDKREIVFRLRRAKTGKLFDLIGNEEEDDV